MWTLEERRNRQDLIELFKIVKGLSRVRIDELFICWMKTRKVLAEGSLFEINENSVHQLDITRHFLIGWSTDGTCWISGQSMHLT